jgi:excinuclease ABC subunit B
VLRALRKGEFDVLVGITCCAKDSIFRSFPRTQFWMQKGRLFAQRNQLNPNLRDVQHESSWRVILYADTRTQISTISRSSGFRRQKQLATMLSTTSRHAASVALSRKVCLLPSDQPTGTFVLERNWGGIDVNRTIKELEQRLIAASNNLEFEKAALLRDQIRELKSRH